MLDRLTPRNIDTLAAASRVIVPPGGALGFGADETRVAARVAADVASWPPRARRQLRILLTAVEALPLVTGYRRTFSCLPASQQADVLAANHHHRSAWRRMTVSLLKQLAFAAYLASPEVEAAIGYRYECARSRTDVAAEPGEQVHR